MDGAREDVEHLSHDRAHDGDGFRRGFGFQLEQQRVVRLSETAEIDFGLIHDPGHGEPPKKNSYESRVTS